MREGKSENVESEDGQSVEVADPGQALQDQARVRGEGQPNTTRSNPDLTKVADEALEEVRRVRDENERHWATHNRSVVTEEVAAKTTSGTVKETGVTLATADGRLYLNSHGEAVLDQDAVIDLQRKLAAAFQAVS